MPQRSTPRVKVELNPPKYKVQKCTKAKKVANKAEHNETWVPILMCVGKEKDLWYLDSGCSMHMTDDSTLLTNFEEKFGPNITFGDDNKEYTMRCVLVLKENFIIGGWTYAQFAEYHPTM